MGNEVGKKFTWVIKNLSTFNYSGEFKLGGCNWCLMAFPKDVRETQPKYLSLYLVVADFESLPCGWRIHAKFSLTVVDQLSDKLSHVKERQCRFDEKIPLVGYQEMIPLSKLHDKDGGFLVNNEMKIVVELDVLEVIGNLDVSEESQEVTQPLKKTKLNDDAVVSSHLHKETSSVKESIDVNGFQVLPSQVDFARHVFEKYPEIALECRTKNQDLRTSYMNVLLSLIKMLYKSPQDASTDDLSDA